MILNTICTIASLVLANYIWARSPSVWTCALFWLAALVLIGVWSKRLPHRVAMLLGVGAVMNFAVTLSNGGFMPVVGKPVEFSSSIWVSAETHGNLLLIADRTALGGASPGDLVIFTGLAIHIGSVFLRAVTKIALVRRYTNRTVMSSS